MTPFESSPRPLLRRAAASGAVVVLSALGLTLIYHADLSREGGIFVLSDHLHFISSYLASRRFGTWLDLQTFPFGQGFGLFQHPAGAHPFWWIWELTSSDQLAYFAAMFVLFAGVLTYYLSLRKNSVFCAIFAAFLCGTAVFNPSLMADYMATGSPQLYFQIGVAYLGWAILLGFGRRSTAWLSLGIVVVTFSIVMDWPYAVFLLPFFLLSAGAALSSLAGAADPRAPARRVHWRQVFVLAGVSVVAGAVLLPPVYSAYDSFTLMSLRLWAHAFMPHETRHSLLIWGGLPDWRSGAMLGWSGLAAAVYHIVRDRSRLLVLSSGLVPIVAVLAFFDNDAAGSGVYWPLPALGYFERPLLPLYVVLFVAALEDLAERFARQHVARWKPAATLGIGQIGAASLLLSMAAAGAIAAFAGLAWAAWPENPDRVAFRKPVQDRRAEDFVKSLSLPAPVWPVYTPYFYDGTSSLIFTDCQHVDRHPYHNYCLFMFNLYATPNAVENQNLIDIQFASIHGQMAEAVSRSAHDRAQLGAAMKSFGIRYVGLDGHWPSAIKYVKAFDQEASLIDLGAIGPEDLSIAKVTEAPYATADAVAARIAHTAIVPDERSFAENQNLSPVDSLDITYRRGAVAIRARAQGDALLLLPFQFSNCLALDNLATDRARLIRVNGGQAALSFAREADAVIRNAFRFFGRPTCRYRDFVDVFRLGLYPTKTVEEMTEGYRVPLLMRWYLAGRVEKRDRLLRQSPPTAP
jgi:hypothetical protein